MNFCLLTSLDFGPKVTTKQRFYGGRAEILSAFTHAQGQLAEWWAWFNRGHNRRAFLDEYEIPANYGGDGWSRGSC